MTSPLLPLRDAIDPALSGGKAVNLAAMIRAGLPVPEGFVVTTAAYRFRGNNDSIPAALAQEIRNAYESMGRPLVAARSSATAEDLAGASMAGQYETFLNLATPEALLDAISKCWISIRNDRVKSYLSEQGIPLDSVAMAVVVQRLVPADVAGVLFTTNPRTADPREMLIEASWGLGESVVSGQVQPDIIRIATARREVLEYAVADKQTRLLPGAQTADPVPEDQRQRACLDYVGIQELCRLGQRAAQHFGCPQDIEWAISGGKVFLLQSRAITTLDDAAAYQSMLAGTRAHLESELDFGRGPWVRHNLGETLHNPTPLTWDVVRRFMSGKGGFGQMYRSVGFEPAAAVADEGFLELIGAGIYMDCARSPQMFAEAFPFAYDIALLRANPDAAQQPPTLPTGKLAARTAAARTATKVTAKLHEEAKTLDSRFDQDFVPTLLAWCLTEESRDLTSLDSATFITLWRDRESKIMGEFGATAFLPSMIEAMAAAELRSFLAEYIWDEDPEELARILGVGAISDCTLKANAELREVALSTRSIDTWLADHGYRAPGEFDLATPRWSERPADLLHLAAPLKDSPDPAIRHRQRTAQAEECLQRLKASLSSNLATELETRTRLLQRYSRFREDGKYYLMRAYNVLRQTALEFSRRLHLATPQEIFYLTTEEIFTALQTGFIPQDRIARRRSFHRVAERLYIPRVVDREDLPSLGTPKTLPGAEQWAAHPVSCGVSTGPAKIVLRPESAVDLGIGYILICPSTDPSWTPLFANASALVLERGGTLSHGAIVAREMGLPAVVLENATTLFKDGEPLTIDSNSGSISRAGSVSDSTAPNDPANTQIERRLMPPPVSTRERNGGSMALMVALAWSALMAAFYLLPPTWLRDPLFRLIDVFLWPLIAKFGYVGGVAIIGAGFSLILLLAQKLLTENSRLFTAKRRAANLRKLANALPAGSPRRSALEKLAAPVSTRILKAAMIPLGFLLGPMMLIFLWFPERVDPAVWNADPGTSVNIIAEIDGDFTKPVTLTFPEPLTLDTGSEAAQSLPEIRRELEDLRAEWQTGSDLNAYPWEVQAAAEHAKDSLLSSLDAFLRSPIPPRKISWRLRVPETSNGRFTLGINLPGEAPQEIPIVFGISHPPVAADFTHDGGSLHSLSVQYPRPLNQRVFWNPLKAIGGPGWDFGWLGVYLLSYLVAMFTFKTVLRIP
jgi:rifampicin phosphotransferase